MESNLVDVHLLSFFLRVFYDVKTPAVQRCLERLGPAISLAKHNSTQPDCLALFPRKNINSLAKTVTHRGARTHDHQVKSLTLYRLS